MKSLNNMSIIGTTVLLLVISSPSLAETIYCPSPDQLENASVSFEKGENGGRCSIVIDSIQFDLFENAAYPFDTEEECAFALQNATFNHAFVVDKNHHVNCQYDVTNNNDSTYPTLFDFTAPFPITPNAYVPDSENPGDWTSVDDINANCQSTSVTDCPVVEENAV